ARDSSQADLIGPGDSCVPDEPRSLAKIGLRSLKSEGSVVSVDNAAERLDDPVDAAGNGCAAFLESGDALGRGFELGLQRVALLLEGLDARFRGGGGRSRRHLQTAGGWLFRLFFCPLSHELIRTLPSRLAGITRRFR